MRAVKSPCEERPLIRPAATFSPQARRRMRAVKVRAKSGPSSGLRFTSPAYGEKENSRARLSPSPCEAGRRWPKSLPRTRYGAG